MELKYLSEAQNASFDAEYHSPQEMQAKLKLLAERFPGGGPRTILDLGGGNGKFLDALLDAFPNARGVLVDISQHLLDSNKPHPRKELIRASVSECNDVLGDRKFDLITVNWLLHHLVGPSRDVCTQNCLTTLEMCKGHLAEGGALFVAENLFEGFAGTNIPSHVIYAITRVKFSPFVRFARRFFNTAGVGVCFRNERDWRNLLHRVGLEPKETIYRPWASEKGMKKLMIYALGLKSRGHGHFFCPRRAQSAA